MRQISIKRIIATLALVCIIPINAYAAGGCNETYDCPESDCQTINEEGAWGSCIEDGSFYVNGYRIYNCAACESGYSQEKQTVTTPDGCTATYYICEKACATCAGGCPDTAWETIGSYQRKYSRYCDCGTCRNGNAQYQCSPGYYGSGTNCTLCPEAPSTYTNSALTAKARGTSGAGTTSQNSCYLPASTYYDATGTLGISGTSCTY